MATIAAVILGHQRKTDGTYNVKYRISHKGEKRYIETEHFVSDRQLDKKGKIKDRFLLSILDKRVDNFRDMINVLESRIDFFTAESLKEYLLDQSGDVDFIKFCRDTIQDLQKQADEDANDNGKRKTAELYQTITNSVVDIFRRDQVSIKEITVEFLRSYERFLRSKRKVERIDRYSRSYMKTLEPLSDTSINTYFRTLRALFNLARAKYNKPSLGIVKIEHYPFAEFKIQEAPESRKRNVDIATLLKIISIEARPGSRMELARDLFKLSFLMCGMNAIDIYNLTEENIKNNRLEYNRIKTRGKRIDRAFISIKITDGANELIKKYLGTLQGRYSTSGGLNMALGAGMKQICEKLGIEGVTMYWARHSFGTIARNKARKSKDDVAMALNHVDSGRKTTDIYIEKDWSILDEIQEAVLRITGLWVGLSIRKDPVLHIVRVFNYINTPSLV
ncbi:MAG: site-specific integrase [Sphingobacterium sp.]